MAQIPLTDPPAVAIAAAGGGLAHGPTPEPARPLASAFPDAGPVTPSEAVMLAAILDAHPHHRPNFGPLADRLATWAAAHTKEES